MNWTKTRIYTFSRKFTTTEAFAQYVGTRFLNVERWLEGKGSPGIHGRDLLDRAEARWKKAEKRRKR